MRMFIVNLTQAIRNLIRYKWQTLISVVGLTFGLVCLAFSVNWFWYETHYESFRKDYDQLYQLKRKDKDPASGEVGSYFPCLLTDVLRRGLTTAEGVTMFDGPMRSGESQVNGTVMELSGYMNVQPDYFDVMGQPLLYGDRRTALTQPGQVVVSRSLAERVFSTSNAVGQRLEIDGTPYTVAGVTSDVPAHSHLQAELYFPYEAANPRDAWKWNNGQVQLVLRTDDPAATARELAALTLPEEMTSIWDIDYFLLPLSRSMTQEEPATFWTDFLYPVAFTAVSALLVLSALFNYIFVLTTQMAGRLREYKLRISLGGTFGANAAWLLTEVGVLQVVVIVLSAAALELASHFSGMPDVCATIYRAWGLCLMPYFVLVALGLVYPLWNLRRLYKAQFAGRAVRPQRPGPMLVVQLTVCVLLLFVFWGAGRQFRLMLDGDLGFTTEHILRIDNKFGALDDVFYDVPRAIRSEGTACIDDAIAVSSDFFGRTGFRGASGQYVGLDDESVRDSVVAFMDVYPGVFRFFDVKPVSGRLFSEQADGQMEFILSPEAQRTLHLQHYADRELSFDGQPARVVGVVDVARTSFHEAPRPIVYYRLPEGQVDAMNPRHEALYVKYKPGMRAEAEQVVARVLKKYEVPADRVEVTSFREYIRSFYETELRYYRLFSLLMAGSVLITLFGVVSMSMYTMRMHRRSIAIRRVYGADFRSLARHYLGGYVGVSLLAAVIAYPVGLYAMTEWLKAYTERVEVGWLQGVAVLAVVVLIVVAVVLWQVRRVMGDNPADVVRSE